MTGVGVELLGVIAVGVGMAAVLYAAMHALRKAGVVLPLWLLPAGVGLAMIGYSVWNDYAWLARAQGRLPEDTRMLLIGRDSQPWAPWTYLAPVAVRFAALDPATISDEVSGIRQARIMLVERRGQTLVVPQQFDCAEGRIRPAHGEWTPAGADDPAFALVCDGEGEDGRDTGDRG